MEQYHPLNHPRQVMPLDPPDVYTRRTSHEGGKHVLHWYTAEAYQRERYQDCIRAAKQRWLIRTVLAQRQHHPGRRARALSWLGRQLVLWGWRLQGQRLGDGLVAPGLEAHRIMHLGNGMTRRHQVPDSGSVADTMQMLPEAQSRWN